MAPRQHRVNRPSSWILIRRQLDRNIRLSNQSAGVDITQLFLAPQLIVDAVKECEQLQQCGVGNSADGPEKMLQNRRLYKQFVDLVSGKLLLSVGGYT